MNRPLPAARRVFRALVAAAANQSTLTRLISAALVVTAGLAAPAHAEDGDVYGGILGGVVMPDYRRDAERGFTMHGLVGFALGDLTALEPNAFAQRTNLKSSTSDQHNTAAGAGLDLNIGRRHPGMPFLLLGVGGTYEKDPVDENTYGYVDAGFGWYLPFDVRNDLYRVEVRWNGVFGETGAPPDREMLNDFRVQIGAAFGARTPLSEKRRVELAASEKIADFDFDGIADPLDRCPNTPTWLKVDPHGCGPDSDADGVFEGVDDCPGTPRGAKVDRHGCSTVQIDTDGDSIPDQDDMCPATEAGMQVQRDGCADVGKVTLGEVHFGLDIPLLSPQGYRSLDQVAAALRQHPEMNIRIDGHADATGPAPYNEKLAYRRAFAAREFLVYRGVAPDRISVKSYGEKQPRASNDSEQGRAQNRRIEFRVVQSGSENDVEALPVEEEIQLISLGEGTP
jgi:OmpA-OmpF porin, OOP family